MSNFVQDAGELARVLKRKGYNHKRLVKSFNAFLHKRKPLRWKVPLRHLTVAFQAILSEICSVEDALIFLCGAAWAIPFRKGVYLGDLLTLGQSWLTSQVAIHITIGTLGYPCLICRNRVYVVVALGAPR